MQDPQLHGGRSPEIGSGYYTPILNCRELGSGLRGPELQAVESVDL